jgi:hypothetical protein
MGGEKDISMETRSVSLGIEWQAEHCRRNDAPVTARVLTAMQALLHSDTATGRRMAEWPGNVLEDAMPLRLAGGFHHLHLTGDDDRLGPIYSGEVTDQAKIDAIILAVTSDHDARLFGWFDGPPQTNEAGRSAAIMGGLLWLSQQLGPRFALYELGVSAGVNTMMDRFAFNLGEVRVGPQDSPVLIKPEWRGPPPPEGKVEIVSIEGCDRAPIDLTDEAQALRLKSYVWAENTARLNRLDAAIGLAKQQRPKLTKADAADWVEELLQNPEESGVTRVLCHSIVWQYLPPEGRARIEAVMAEVGARATQERPLAWIMLETNRQTFRHELRVRYWPGREGWALLGEAHAHGAWVEWYDEAR